MPVTIGAEEVAVAVALTEETRDMALESEAFTLEREARIEEEAVE